MPWRDSRMPRVMAWRAHGVASRRSRVPRRRCDAGTSSVSAASNDVTAHGEAFRRSWASRRVSVASGDVTPPLLPPLFPSSTHTAVVSGDVEALLPPLPLPLPPLSLPSLLWLPRILLLPKVLSPLPYLPRSTNTAFCAATLTIALSSAPSGRVLRMRHRIHLFAYFAPPASRGLPVLLAASRDGSRNEG